MDQWPSSPSCHTAMCSEQTLPLGTEPRARARGAGQNRLSRQAKIPLTQGQVVWAEKPGKEGAGMRERGRAEAAGTWGPGDVPSQAGTSGPCGWEVTRLPASAHCLIR